MPTPELRMCFADRAALALELDANLKHGRAFVKDAEGIAALTDCSLLVVHPDDGAELALPAQAVLVCDSGPMRGIGVQLRPFDAEVAQRLAAFVAGVREPPSAPEPQATAASSESAIESNAARSAPDTDPAPTPDPAADTDADAEPGADADPESDDELAADLQKQPARHERLRKLSVTEQQKVARGSDMNDRMMLERLYGKHVWDALLHNPKLTLPEVASIARKGSIPRPLLEFIVDNNAWIQSAIVRRALLGNPRVSGEAIMKLLRMTPKHELKTIYKTTTYSSQVREAARKVLES
jgi:hypothetical protein